MPPPAPPSLRVEYAAEVLVELADGEGRRGSGYLIAPRKVLTAQHVVRDATAVQVRFNADRADQTQSAAAVIWQHAGIDIAVLAVSEAPPAVPTEFGRVGERDAVIHASAVGFPAFKMRIALDGSRYRDVEHLRATCAVLSNRREGTLDLSVPPPAPPADGSPWAAMSGAAVLSRGRIIGVVTEHHLSDGPGRLAASRVDRWSELLSASDLAALEIVIGAGLRPSDLQDVVPPHHHESAITAFTADVQSFAPTELLDRQDELEQLVRFCAGPDPYHWIQGTPWAGKTALTSWLALHPPHGVVPVWFFVSNRRAGNADGPAYVEALIPQCAALAGRDAITTTAQAARAGELRLLLGEAAKRVAAQGSTLLLIVDGLDEDRSTGDSIASLLPSSPPDHLRVLVTSRPHPGLPVDVAPDHPLRSCPVLQLDPSNAARNIRHEATLEMDEALRSDELTHDVIGLLAAARGNLTVRDLQELTERRRFEVKQRLDGLLKRMLRPTVSSPASRSERGYGFAHDDLLVVARDHLEDEIHEYETLINEWADSYKAQGWPEGTPYYLLSGYVHQVTSLGDTESAVRLATDVRRIDRIRKDIGIGPVLAENTSVESATDSEEHLSALARARERAVDLAVHGIDETSPARILNDPRVELVSGDHTAGIYRRVDDRDASDGPVSETYSWANLALGNGTRTLWLLLLPFVAVNLAHWAKPGDNRRPRARHAYDALVRLLGLALTVLPTAVVCEVLLDLVAWQCAGTAPCANGKPWLAFLAPGANGWWSEPGRRLAICALIPAAGVGLMTWLSRLSWTTHESSSPPPQRFVVGDYGPWHSTLESPGFWYGRAFTASLRAAHTAAGLLTVTTALVAAALAEDRSAPGAGALEASGWALVTTVTLTWLAVVGVVARRGRSEGSLDPRPDAPPGAWALPVAASAQLALALIYVGWSRPHWPSAKRLPAADTIDYLTLVPWLLTTALAVVTHLMIRTNPDRGALRGQAGPAFAAVACALAAGFSGGAAELAASWLDPGNATAHSPAIAGPPVLLVWHATLLPLVTLLGVGLVVLAAIRQSRLRRSMAAQVVADYPDELYDKLEAMDRPRTRAIADAMARAKITDSAPTLLGSLACAVVVLTLAATVGALTTQELPGRATSGAAGSMSELGASVQAMGAWLVGLLVALLLTMSWLAYRNPAARRTIGLFWEVCTFWPRAAHPLAPPSYAERAVADLSWRLTTSLLDVGRRPTVLRGYGQGSVLIAAALWQLEPRLRTRVSFLTCGSPLGRIYGQWFPAYFGRGDLHALRLDLNAWRNGWRRTDPIGGPIAIGDGWLHVDFGPLKDPLRYGRTAHEPLPAPILGHRDYQQDPLVQQQRSLLHTRIDDDVPPPRTP